MKTALLNKLFVICFLSLFSTFTFSANVVVKALLKDAEDNTIPNVYIRLYVPGTISAIDSMFTDNKGYLEYTSMFTYIPSHSVEHKSKNFIVKALYPNIINKNTSEYYIEYNYPTKASVNITDIQGRKYSAGSEFAPGIYFYYLNFTDGNNSEVDRMIVTEKCHVNINLIPADKIRIGSLKSLKSVYEETNVFYAEFIKDGYITLRDTIKIDSTIITKNYILSSADIPTADFSFSGDMKTGHMILFDASGSFGANSEDLIYSWDFDDGRKGQSVAIPHIFNKAGSYDITLSVSGDYGARHSITKTITVEADTTVTDFEGIANITVTLPNLLGVNNAVISLVEGETMAITDTKGMAEITGLPVGIPIHLKISKEGYVSQVVTITIPEDTKKAYFFSTLKSRNAAIKLEKAEFGGQVAGADGATVQLPYQSLLKSDGTSVTGDVSVSITPVNVVEAISSFPGSFNAFNQEGEDGVLLSYGVSEFHFMQDEEELQLAPGKTAIIYIPVYTSGTYAGDKIPLWSVNEENGMWVQEGIGTVVNSDESPTGYALKAEAGHFSWWNCDDFDEDRDKNSKCVKVEVVGNEVHIIPIPCFISGKRDNSDLPPGYKSAKIHEDKKELKEGTMPSVFEVREFLPASGLKLKYPVNIDVYIQARSYDENGDLYFGDTTLAAGADLSNLDLRVDYVKPPDTAFIEVDSIYEEYLFETQKLMVKVNIPETKKYYIYLFAQNEPRLNGYYEIRNDTSIIISGETFDEPAYMQFEAGEILIGIKGIENYDEGYFKFGVFTEEPNVYNLEVDTTIDGYLIQKEFLKYVINFPQSGKYDIFITSKISPTLQSKFNVIKSEDTVCQGNYLDYPKTFYADSGRYTIKIEGIDDYDYGNFTFGIYRYDSTHIQYGDTVSGKVSFRYDTNIYSFNGNANDLIAIEGIPVYYNGLSLVLIDPEGNKLVERKNGASYCYNIIYELPSDGIYTILVYNGSGYVQNYDLAILKPEFKDLNYNTLTEFDVEPDKNYYIKFEIPETKYMHSSILAGEGGGYYNIFKKNGDRLLTTASSYYFSYVYNPSYGGIYEAGEYYILIENGTNSKLFINLLEAESLSFDNKGNTSFVDTLLHAKSAKTYILKPEKGDAIHTVLKRIEGQVYPEKLEIKYFRIPNAMYECNYRNNYLLSYRTTDSSILNESSVWVEAPDTSIIIVIHAADSGVFEFNMTFLKSQKDIIVDDDFNEFPDATTNSLIAAFAAVQPGGSVYIANGTYSSNLTASQKADSVDIEGQSKGGTILKTLNYYTNNTILSIYNNVGSMKNLTFECSNGIYYSFFGSGDNLIIENIDVKAPGNGDTITSGISFSGDNLIVRNMNLGYSLYGMNISSTGGTISNCNIIADQSCISSTGSNLTIKNNTATLVSGIRAFDLRTSSGQGGLVVDSNTVFVLANNNDDYTGIIEVAENGYTSDTNITYVRYNNIVSNGRQLAFDLVVGRPPSKLIVEHNNYTCNNPLGSRALLLSANRTDGSSDIIVRNNIFDGIASSQAIHFYGVSYIDENSRFVVCNNNFRMAPAAESIDTNFIMVSSSMAIEDTANVYIMNNIFDGNGSVYFLKCNYNFSVYSDYNVVYNFPKYLNVKGKIIGTSNDITTDPQYIDDDLHINVASDAVDNGAGPALYDNIPTVDYEGTVRPQGSGYDIGAYEQ